MGPAKCMNVVKVNQAYRERERYKENERYRGKNESAREES